MSAGVINGSTGAIGSALIADPPDKAGTLGRAEGCPS